MSITGVRASRWVLAACLSLAGGACVSPDTFIRTDGGPGSGAGGEAVIGGGGGPGAGGTVGAAGKTGTAGSPGVAGTSGSGGRIGTGGTPGTGGTVIGPTPNFMDDFEHGDSWISDSPTNTALNPSSSPCGDWAVVTDPVVATNHVFQQRTVACGSSNPSWSANGNVAWTDMRLQARVQFGADATTSTKITLGVRFVDDRTNYFIEYTNNGRIKIRSKTTSSTTDVNTLASNLAVPVAAGQWVTIALAVSGTTLNVYLGDNPSAPPVLTGTATVVSSGGIGLGVAQGTALFDDVLVTAP
jgi:hypothetical protein